MPNSTPAPAAPVPSRGRVSKLVPLIVVAVCSLGAGILVPRYLM